jgi:hypothetical protein
LNLKKLNTGEYNIISNEIFPIVLNVMLEEEQEEKLNLIVNSFNYCVNKRFFDKDMIITYYDVLSSLRTIDLTYLMSKATESEEMDFFKKDIEKLISDKSEESGERRIAVGYILQKLSRLDLLTFRKTFSDLEGGSINDFEKKQFTITDFAKNFLSFIEYRRREKNIWAEE